LTANLSFRQDSDGYGKHNKPGQVYVPSKPVMI
jgi:hypothetical protein